jgi:hypothetical protein
MADRHLFIYALDGFRPFNDEAQAWTAKCELGQIVELKPTRVRNGKFHRLFFAILKLISENSDPHITPETTLYLAKVGAGCGEWISTPGGKDLFVPGSIAFGSMSEDDFQAFVKAAIPPLCIRFLHGAAADSIIAEAMELAA